MKKEPADTMLPQVETVWGFSLPVKAPPDLENDILRAPPRDYSLGEVRWAYHPVWPVGL